MKRNIILTLALMLSAVVFLGCASTAPVATSNSQPVGVVDEEQIIETKAIGEAPPRFEASLSVAVLEFEGGTGQDAITLADLIGTRLANKRIFNVLTRTSVAAIMKEHNFQRIGVTNTESIKAIGELVNADYIIVGKITMLGDKNLLTVQMINVVSGNIESGGDIAFEDIGDTLSYIDTMVGNIVGIETETTPVIEIEKVAVSIVSDTTLSMYAGREGIELIKALISKDINAIDDNGYTPLILASSYGYTELVKELIAVGADLNATTYEGISALEFSILNEHKWVKKALKDAGATGIFIGETGPGGGLVFYIDGDTYLECSELLGTANWNDAFTLAEDYRGGGYDDWHLPNREELDSIYENLREKNFITDNGWLWSSAEHNNFDAWGHDFDLGNQNYSGKSYKDSVRAVRSFYSKE